jgi:hypothetical protein
VATRRAAAAFGDALDKDQTPTAWLKSEILDTKTGLRKQQCRTVNLGSWFSSADGVGTKSTSKLRASNHDATPLKCDEPINGARFLGRRNR